LSDEQRKPERDENIEKNISGLQQALNYDWPAIQLHPTQQAAAGKDDAEYVTSYDGKRKVPSSLDSWWLKDYIDEDVLLRLPGVVIMNMKPWHINSVCISYRDAYGIPWNKDCDDCFDYEDFESHIAVFPEGQFVAQRISEPVAGNCVGMASTMRTSRPPSAPALPWREAIGDLKLAAHEPSGDWLYGVEMAVHTNYQRGGIGFGLYRARFQFLRSLRLRGWYAVGMLMGYKNYASQMDVRSYGEKVIAGEIKDPTVSLQLKLGFQARGIVENYCDEPAAGDAGVLIVWENPAYSGGA